MATIVHTKFDWKALGEYVAERRKEMGMTQTDLANAIGRKQPDISDIERGTSQSTLETLINISEALGVKPDRLLTKFLKKER